MNVVNVDFAFQAKTGDKFLCILMFRNIKGLFIFIARCLIAMGFESKMQHFKWTNSLDWKIKMGYCRLVSHFTWSCHRCILDGLPNHLIHHFRINRSLAGWAHSQRRVGVNITIPLHWPSCEWTLTLPIFLVFCSLSAIISFQTCSNKCILYVLSFHKCIKIKYKMVNMYGVFRD